jgi:hypothetical protein
MHIHDVTKFAAMDQSLPIKIFCDNRLAGQLFDKLKTNSKVKHLNMRIQAIREWINAGFIAIHFVLMDHNVADSPSSPPSSATAASRCLATEVWSHSRCCELV